MDSHRFEMSKSADYPAMEQKGIHRVNAHRYRILPFSLSPISSSLPLFSALDCVQRLIDDD